MTRSPRRSGLEGGTQVGDQTAVVFARSKLTYAMTLIRLLLILNFLLPPDMSEWLYSANLRSVLIDPIFTIEHVKEAAAVRHLSTASSNFVDAYRGHSSGNSRIHAPPLVLVAFESMLLHIPNDIYWQHVVIAIFLLLVDFWIAGKLEELAANVLQREDPREVELLKKMDPRILPEMAHIFPSGPPATETSTAETLIRWHDLPLCIAQLYYCNPVTVVAGSGAAMSCCFQNLRLAFLVTALAESSSSFRKGVEGSAVTTAFALAVASYLDLHCVVFIVPTVIWHGGDTKAKTFGVLWDVFTIALQGLSTLLVGLDNYASIFRSTHLHQYRLKGLAPSLTTVWYFSMEVFMRFRVYFEFLLAGLPYLLVFPVTIRLRRYPAALVRTALR